MEEEITKNPKTEIKIKLLTYNIFMRPPGINEKGKDDYKDTRQKMISEKVVPNYDILFFQELFPSMNPRRKRIIKSAKKNGITYCSLPAKAPLFSIHKVNSGLLNLSRYKISKTIFKPYKACSGIDAIAYKGVLYSKIIIQDQVLHLFNTHLQASYGSVLDKNKKGKYKQKRHFESRLRQIIELRKFITDTLIEESIYSDIYQEMNGIPMRDKILVTGDFNSEFARMLPKFFEKIHNQKARDFINNYEGDKFDEYEFLVYVLSNYGDDEVIDHLADSYGYKHPHTATGVLREGNREPITGKRLENHLRRRSNAIDFWFEIKPHKESQTRLYANDKKCCFVRPFFVNHPKVDKLSDHYGVELTFNIN